MVRLIRGDLRSRLPTSRTRFLSRVALFDLAWAATSPVLAFVARDGGVNRPDAMALYAAIAVVASLLSFQWFRISTPITGFFSVHDASRIVQACFATVALTVIALFSVTRLEEAPRSIPVIHLLILTTGLVGQRAWHRLAARQENVNGLVGRAGRTENILIVGASRLGWFFSKMVEEFAPQNIRIVAILDERAEVQNRSLNGYSIVGSPLHLAKIVEEYANHGIEVHKVVLAVRIEDMHPPLWEEIRRVCEVKNVRTEWLYERFLMPSQAEAPLSPVEMETLAADSGPRGSYWRIKHMLDVALALVGIFAAAPLLLGVGLLVLIDVGLPIVFWQQRIGRFGRPLHVYKFRTMRASFDRLGHPIPDTQRLSSLGHMMRRNRLDELPQLFSILWGEMSVVGPRPLLPIDQPNDARIRLQVRPGLTGLAQINGGKLLSPEEKDALDEWYVNHASLRLDLKIIMKTIWMIAHGDRRNEAAVAAALVERSARMKASEAFMATPVPEMKSTLSDPGGWDAAASKHTAHVRN